MKKLVWVVGIVVVLGILAYGGYLFYLNQQQMEKPITKSTTPFQLMLMRVANQSIEGTQNGLIVMNITSGEEINFPYYEGGKKLFANYSYGAIYFECSNISESEAEALAIAISREIQLSLDNLSYVDLHFSCVCGWQIGKTGSPRTMCPLSSYA